MRGRLTAMPLAKSRKATPHRLDAIAHRQEPLDVVVGDDDGHVWLRSLAPFRRAGNLSPGCRHWQCPCVRLGSASSIAPGKDHAMTDDFEDHCWKDVISPDVLDVYACYQRKTFVGPNAALLAIDLYEVVYRGRRAAAAQARQDPSEFLRRICPRRDRADQAAVRRRARSGPADLLFDRRHPHRKPSELRHRHQARAARRSIPPTTRSVRSSSRSQATWSSPSSAPACSSARR